MSGQFHSLAMFYFPMRIRLVCNLVGYCSTNVLAKLIIFLYLQPHYVTKLDGAQMCKDEKDNNYCTEMVVTFINIHKESL